MKANIILKALIKNDVNLECCGTVRVDEELTFSDFIHRYFDPEYHVFFLTQKSIVPEGEWFYVWHTDDIDFGFGECYTILRIGGQSLHIMLLDEE
ncbi:MAG: hypothetical protein J6M53_05255 [Bacteroidaceae bacterium]|nr:hypothetical protein [Bacteroidaceae bacterium]